MLMSLDHSQLQVIPKNGECTSTDHSIFKPDTQVEDSWIQSLTDWSLKPEMVDQPKTSTSNTRPELLGARVTTTMLWISETHGVISMVLTVNLTNSSSSEKANSSTVRPPDILMLMLRMPKENKLLQLQRMERSIRNGESSTLTKLPIKLDLDRSMLLEVCTLTDHSSLFQECGWTELFQLPEDGTLSFKPEKTTKTRDNNGFMISHQRPFNPFMTRRDPWTSEVEMLMLTPLIQDGINSSSMIMAGLSMKRVKFLLFKANLIIKIDNA
jgi:hypothetical protein